MSDRIAYVLKQIQFCETYLAKRTDPDDPTNTREIRVYVEEQLALAKSMLASTNSEPEMHTGAMRKH